MSDMHPGNDTSSGITIHIENPDGEPVIHANEDALAQYYISPAPTNHLNLGAAQEVPYHIDVSGFCSWREQEYCDSLSQSPLSSAPSSPNFPSPAADIDTFGFFDNNWPQDGSVIQSTGDSSDNYAVDYLRLLEEFPIDGIPLQPSSPHSTSNLTIPLPELVPNSSSSVDYLSFPTQIQPLNTTIPIQLQPQYTIHHRHSRSLPITSNIPLLSLDTSQFGLTEARSNTYSDIGSIAPHIPVYADGIRSPLGHHQSPNSPSPSVQNDNALNNNFLQIPSTPLERRRSYTHVSRHARASSEGNLPRFSLDDMAADNALYLAASMSGLGLHRNRSAPPTAHVPYNRPTSRNSDYGEVSDKGFSSAGEVSSMSWGNSYLPSPTFPSTSTSTGSSPVESDLHKVISTNAMRQAAQDRRKNPARFHCTMCSHTFTTENSRKRHENSHTNAVEYSCSMEGCTQKFKNDSDRRRHERKAKVHRAP